MSYESRESGDWFDPPTGERGLRFGCTMCGNCCSGPEGYVLVSDAEVAALAARFGIASAEFIERYTHMTREGRSLRETPSPAGLDCVFLDRTSVPGRAVCGVYEDRPTQCRTWPFWGTLVRSRRDWDQAARRCPGIGRGPLIPPEQVRILRDMVPM
jgi:Fe-S-cluster containining protein